MRDLTALGYVKDLPHKKLLFAIFAMTGLIAHSAAYSSESLEDPILDQNATGSCTGHGTSQWVRVTYAKAGRPLPFRPSPKGIYAVTRGLDRAAATMPGQPLPTLTDAGGMPADVVIGIAQFGILPLVEPSPLGFASDIDSSNVNDELKLGDFEKALAELLQAARIVDPTASTFQDDLATAIEVTGAAAIGIFVDSGFEAYSPATGPVQSINQQDPNGGGHWLAVTSFRTVVAGSDDDVKFHIPVGTLIFRGPNSWTPSWGDAGHYEIIGPCLSQVCSDCYAIFLPTAKAA